MKKLLIMGGSYFIGKKVVDACKDSLDTYVLNRGNKPFNDPQVTELKADRNNSTEMKNALSKLYFDYIVDVSGLNQSHEEILIDALNLENLQKFIFISSSAVYNIQKLTAPFKENEALGGDSPFADYASNKIDAELYLSSVFSQKELYIFRPPVVYGEENYVLRERLIFKMIEEDMNIYIPKSNNQIQFIYANDLAIQIKEALEGVIPPGIYNVGNKKALHFNEWIHLCEKVVDKKAKIFYMDVDECGVKARLFFPFFDYDNILSVDKIRKFSTIETPMMDGLKKAYLDYQKVRENVLIPDKMLETFEIFSQALINRNQKEII